MLHEISFQLLPEQRKSFGSPSINAVQPVDADNDTSHDRNKGCAARQKRGKAPASRGLSAASARFEPYAGHTSKKHIGNPIIALGELFERPECLHLDCPIQKWYLAHVNDGLVSPCEGCAERHMNGVRQHLLPSYSQQHGRHVSFIKRCGRCTEDIVDEAVWESGGHRARTCSKASQPRGISVIVWARLFLKIFPGETSVPSPCTYNDSLQSSNC